MTPMLRQEANETFRRMLLRTVLLPLILMVALAGTLFWLITDLQQASRWVEHTDQVLAETNELRASVLEQQASLRAFLLTGTDSSLERYNANQEPITTQIITLETLVVDNQPQIDRFKQLATNISSWQARAQEAINLKRTNGDYLSWISSDDHRTVVNAIRETTNTIIHSEEQLRVERINNQRTTSGVVLTATLLITLVLGGLLAFFTRRTLFQLSHTYNTALHTAEQNEQELYTQREWFRSTLSSIGDAVIATDVHGNISFMNDVAEALTGWTFDAAQNKPLQDVFTIVNEQTREPVEIPVNRVLREGVVVGLANHTALIRRDGTSLPIDDSAAPVRDARGAMVGAVLVFRDISERYRSEALLRESEQRYREVAEAMPMVVWTAAPTGETTYFNTQWYTYSGQRTDEPLGKGWQAVIHPDDLDRTIARWSQAINNGEFYEIEYRWRRADGEYRWFLGRGVPFRDQNGNITQWIGTGTDIDDQKQIEERLRDNEMRSRQINDSMLQLVWTTRADGYHEYFNQRWYDYTGTSLEEARGDGWSRILHPDDYQHTLAMWEHSLRTGELYEIEYRFKQASTGEYRWFLGRAAPVRDKQGQIVQWFGTCTDINAQKQAETQLLQRQEALSRATATLEERNRELDQFAYVTSHDLKAPLRGIANLSQWIEEDLGEHATEDIRKQMELLRGRVHRMEGLIDGILQYSRVGRVRSERERIDIGELIEDVIDLLAPAPTITINVEADMPTVRSERLHLQQVFQNLINNAIKHGQRPDLTIDVGCRERGDFYEFSVRDNGQGIAPQYHDRIFVIFQTLASRDKVEGTGLGLSLIKKIVEHHGGKIWLESAEGAGAIFFFTWPKSE